MTKSSYCYHGEIIFILNLFYIIFLQVFSIEFSVNLSSRHLVDFSWTTMEIRVTMQTLYSVFYPWWPVWWPWLFYIMFTCRPTVYWNKSNQIKNSAGTLKFDKILSWGQIICQKKLVYNLNSLMVILIGSRPIGFDQNTNTNSRYILARAEYCVSRHIGLLLVDI